MDLHVQVSKKNLWSFSTVLILEIVLNMTYLFGIRQHLKMHLFFGRH